VASNSRSELDRRLADVDELILAHASLTGGRVGRPRSRQGAAITRAGIVLLAAAMEAYVEDLFEEAASLLWPGASPAELKALLQDTVGRFNNADVRKTELLYFNLGMPWTLSGIHWQKFSNATFKSALNQLVETRNQIAHGRAQPRAQLQQLRRWKEMVRQYALRLEAAVVLHIQRTTGTPPAW
jgi:hypothetical protein